ncbi:MAG TPA: glycosyltransferase [Candidatus Saccharimonadales bacterium]
MPGKKKKIVVLTIPVGGGHLTAAKIIHQALQAEAGEAAEIVTIDVLHEWLPGSPQFFTKGYENSVKNFRSTPYKLVYNFADAQPKLVEDAFALVFQGLGKKLIEREQPDVIVTTFPIVSYVIHKVLQTLGRKMPIISIVTDAGDVHKLWFMGINDTVITATEDTIAHAVRSGVPREKLHYFGFPVLTSFKKLPSRKKAREQLGYRDMPTVLITNGGLGMNPKKVLNIAEEIAARKLPYQVAFICGKNESLYNELMAMDFGQTPVHIYQFVPNMPTFLAACDIVCTKAGWLSVSEAIEARRPMILFDIIPGQEEPNAQYVLKHGFGEVIANPANVVSRLEALLGKPALLKAYQTVYKDRVSGGVASKRIAEFILGQV